MKTIFRLFMTVIGLLTAIATFSYFAENMAKEKKYIVMNDTTNEIY